MKKITRKQQRFIDAYDGETKSSAAIAGLSYEYCRQLITKPHILCAIQERETTERAPIIATRQQRQEFWAQIMYDKGQATKDRLRASELLGKSEKDFVDRVEQSGPNGGPIETKQVFETPEELRAEMVRRGIPIPKIK